MDAQAGCYTTILLLPGGSTTAPSCIINLLSVGKEGGTWGENGVCTTYDGYPSREHATFGGRSIVQSSSTTKSFPHESSRPCLVWRADLPSGARSEDCTKGQVFKGLLPLTLVL